MTSSHYVNTDVCYCCAVILHTHSAEWASANPLFEQFQLLFKIALSRLICDLLYCTCTECREVIGSGWHRSCYTLCDWSSVIRRHTSIFGIFPVWHVIVVPLHWTSLSAKLNGCVLTTNERMTQTFHFVRAHSPSANIQKIQLYFYFKHIQESYIGHHCQELNGCVNHQCKNDADVTS